MFLGSRRGGGGSVRVTTKNEAAWVPLAATSKDTSGKLQVLVLRFSAFRRESKANKRLGSSWHRGAGGQVPPPEKNRGTRGAEGAAGGERGAMKRVIESTSFTQLPSGDSGGVDQPGIGRFSDATELDATQVQAVETAASLGAEPGTDSCLL